MRTTLDLDRELLEKTRAALGTSTLTETIETALEMALHQVNSNEGWAKLIGSDLSWESPEALARYRREFGGRSS